MRLHQLHEQYVLHKLSSLPSNIQKDCSDVIDLYRRTNKVFLRGDGSKLNAFKADIRKNRKPLHMGMNEHEAIVAAFEKLNLPVNRQNSIFCTTDHSITEDWGQTYIIFPVNGWKGLVFENSRKIYVFTELQDILADNMNDHGTFNIDGLAKDIDKLKPRLFEAHDGDFVLQKNFTDILITGSHYYGLKVEKKDLLKNLGIEATNAR